ncbi:GTP-binding protein 2-like [Amyelois transitella]|uniref:GTP-binding protein 2-like n=1 Tax=Amyelois transitella TaxID=680683 RepID=UPI00298FD801|nr:GTP-binding protein 2-like [Amyelois transitella]
MDSFFSLFDPADGHQSQKQSNKKKHKQEQDTVKKKPDAPKGRRRGRKSQGKNETLPEESSFLCEPDLSTELLVKSGSYIESYIEVNTDSKTDDKRPKRRNSSRKNRRKKNKISPPKESASTAWDEKPDHLNNQTSITPNKLDDSIGKNVNDLTDGYKFRRKDIDNKYGNEVYNVIDKLEKVRLKDDVYMNGDFCPEDLDNDFCSSDDMESYDDSASEAEDSGDEVYGRLPPEPRFGNVEYKLQLVAPCERRFQHLVTQLKWRLRSGGGSAVYVVGVRDCGALRGLRARPLRASLHALRGMARALGAALAHVAVRRVGPQRAVAEVYIRKLADTQQSVELRVAVMGANEAGKSTIIGVLTQGELDNGRGSARLNMFRHLHEVKSGRTSSLSHEILGFDAQGNVVNYGCSELMTAERIGERSAKLVSFLDLAGHSKYQRTTVHGLTGYSPHYAMLVISATAGITRITEEHIDLLIALDLPFFTVISKCEQSNAVAPLLGRLRALLHTVGKKPLLITDENMARDCVAPQKLILDSINDGKGEEVEEGPELEHIPVFPVSCVRGAGLNALHAYLLALQPPSVDVKEKPEDETCEFQIDEIFHVGDSEGPVVGGLMAKGQIYEGDQLIIGPTETGSFVPITVRSVYRNRAPCARVTAGHCASLGLSAAPSALRPGQVLLTYRAPRAPRRRPQFGGCNGNCVASLSVQELMKQSQTDNDNRKSVRRKNKNLLEQEDDADGPECTCEGRVYLEDPEEPRGCLFFQATVQVLRHSTSIGPGFQCTVHVGNVRQTAIVEGIMSRDSVIRAGEAAPALFRFVRLPEFLARGRRLLFTAGGGTRGIGRVTQVFPYIP